MPDGEWDAALSWLRKQIDVEAEAARVAWHGDGWRAGMFTLEERGLPTEVWTGRNAPGHTPIPVARAWDAATADHIGRHDPATVLRRVESDRRILAIFDMTRDSADHDVESEARFYLMADVVKAFAQRYAHLPDFPEVLRLDRERDG